MQRLRPKSLAACRRGQYLPTWGTAAKMSGRWVDASRWAKIPYDGIEHRMSKRELATREFDHMRGEDLCKVLTFLRSRP